MRVIFVALLFLSVNLFASSAGIPSGQSKTDSLLTLLKNDKEDTNKVNHLTNLAFDLYSINPDSTILLAQRAASLAEKINFQKGEANAYGTVGIGYWAKGNYPNALENYFIALKIDEALKNKRGISKRLGNIGSVYLQQGDYPKALDYYFKALKIGEELGDKNRIANQLGNIGIVYRSQTDYPKALVYYFKALKTFEELGNKNSIAAVLGNIGIVYSKQGDYPKALEYHFKALKMDEEIGDKNGMAADLGNIGQVYADEADTITANDNSIRKDSLQQNALDYYFKALKMNEELGRKSGIAMQLGNIGDLYTAAPSLPPPIGEEKKGFVLAAKYLYRALALSDSIGAMDGVKDDYEQLSTLYEKSTSPLYDSVGGKLLNMEEMRLRALYYHKRYIAVRDRLFSEENKKQLVQKEMNYEFEKKEAAAKNEQDKKDAVAAEERKRKQLYFYLIVAIAVAVVVIAGINFRSLRITRRQKEVIEEKNKLVEEKNRNITDSINYAKRIQESLMLSEEEINKILPYESFVFFQPKDIVSGDFYWFSSVNNNGNMLYVAVVADCTGHGVPGAFLSMMGNMLLNEIVNEKLVTDPAVILKGIHHGIFNSLHRENESDDSLDGMEIALCVMDPSNKVIRYAGAMNPLYIVRQETGSDTAKLEIIKANILSLGGKVRGSNKPKEVAFTNHSIPLVKGMSVYLFSDGYMDQFNRKRKQRFGSKQFKQLLLDSAQLSMKQQKTKLSEALDVFKEDEKQIDDILVMGIKF